MSYIFCYALSKYLIKSHNFTNVFCDITLGLYRVTTLTNLLLTQYLLTGACSQANEIYTENNMLAP